MATITTVASEGTYTPFLSFGPYPRSGNLYVICCDLQTYRLMAYRSTDSGATWANVSDEGPEIERYTVDVGGTPEVRNTVPGAHFDGSLVHLVYFQAADTAAEAYATHCSFDTETHTWSAPVAADWSTVGSEASPSIRLHACEWPGGGILAGWTEFNPSGSWTRAVVGRFDSGTWSDIKTVAAGVYNDSQIDGLAKNTETDGAHVIINVSSSLNHVAFGSDMAEGDITFVSDSGGGTAFSVKSWTYGGSEYLGILWTESTRMEAAVTASASISFSSKTVYVRNEETESALGFSGVLAPSGPSLHAFFWWLTSSPTPATEGLRLYKSCLAYLTSDPWTLATQIAAHDLTVSDNEPGMMNGYVSGSIFRGCYAPDEMNVLGSGTAGDGFVNYFTESLTACGSVACCCANFAY